MGNTSSPSRGGPTGLIALVLVTGIAVAAGGGVGLQLATSIGDVTRKRADAEAGKTPVQIRYSGDTVLTRLQPIIVNLDDPPETWIRLETAIVFENGALSNPDETGAQIAQDVVAYLRTLSLKQLQGPSGLSDLREDLADRVAIRTDGAVQEFIIETMVVQ